MTPNGTSKSHRFDYRAFILKYAGATLERYAVDEPIYAQGDVADAAYYIVNGLVKVTVTSAQGKEAVLALLKAGDFFGEECLHPGHRRPATVSAKMASEIVRLDRDSIARALGEHSDFATLFLDHVMEQNERLREELVDQLFNSSEKRLARVLLALASSTWEDQVSEIAIPLTQETLASMVGTTRPRISQFMNKFRKLGYIDYDGRIRVHNSLTKVITSEAPHNIEC
jgi:CRP/FNR family transcriptional regulator, cyclic AMP receptor protein